MNETLKTRAITAVFFTIAVLLLLYINSCTQFILFATIGLGASYELLKMKQVKPIFSFALLLFLAILYIGSYFYPATDKVVLVGLVVTCVFHLFLAINLFYGKSEILKLLPLSVIIYPAGASLLVITSLLNNSQETLSLILGTISFIWLSDSFAYLVGRKIGKNKLFERISPNKTWEGFYGGGVAAIVGAIIISYLIPIYQLNQWVIIALIAWILGTIGDLTQSALKRKYGVKDSGNILPGHGGFFDRFDSLIFVLPFVYLIINYF